MGQPLGGFGQGLPIPQNLYPSELNNAAQDVSNNKIDLSPGDVFIIPAGTWWIGSGANSFLQYLDPITGIWSGSGSYRGTQVYVKSDGANVRLANLTGCPIGAVVAGGGTGFTQATAAITANIGGSTWQPIVGGSLSVVSVAAAGANYTMPPIVAIPGPPAGAGAQATGYAVLANGTVASVTLSNVGAGYTTTLANAVQLLPNPADPNFGSITQASIAVGLTNAGKITAALCTNNGAALATLSALTLTASGGAGSGATITPAIIQVITNASATGGGGYSAANELTTIGGVPASVSAIGNPLVEYTGYRARPAQIQMAQAAGVLTSAATIFDSGMFAGTPTALMLNNGITTTAATIVLTLGGLKDTVTIQPAN